jgi:hypothetical protein
MIHAYPVAGKAKSYEICEAFVRGAGGAIVTSSDQLQPGAAFFYGVDSSNIHLFRQAKGLAQELFYCDNSYFDSARQGYFRVTRNRIQHHGHGVSTGERFRQLGVAIEPWKKSGEHILVCPQSDSFMRDIVNFNGNWLSEITGFLKTSTKRPVKVREWSRDKGALAATLVDDLQDAYALVTWSSAAAITAVLNGVPIFCGGDCAAQPMSGSLMRLEEPKRAERAVWAGVLADNQWTLNEFRSGVAWKALNG